MVGYSDGELIQGGQSGKIECKVINTYIHSVGGEASSLLIIVSIQDAAGIWRHLSCP